jgi:ABC-type nitrate/sulfonate/bicarbonate transport system substrate-binding protein
MRGALAAIGTGTIAGITSAFAGKLFGSERFNLQSAWLNDPEFIGYMIAIDNGYYAAQGLSVHYMPGGPDVNPAAGLLSGKADISLSDLTGTAKAWEKGGQLKIIGVQYQKSPLGVISLEKANIKAPRDLIDRTVACPALDLPTFQALLKVAGVPKDKVRVAPFASDPVPLLSGEIDAVVEFVTDLPFLIEQRGGQKTSYFLFCDVGLPLFIDLVTVTSDTLTARRGQLVKFLRASRKGWMENNADPAKYPAKYSDTWFKDSGLSLAEESFYNRAQISLMANPKGLFTIDAAAVDASLAALEYLGLKGSKDMFDPTVLAEV